MKILFVCLGNICRSPLAKGIMKDKIDRKGLDAQVDSAGFESYHVGGGADYRSIQIASRHGIDIRDHKARRFTSEDFDRFDRIYVMDHLNYSDVIESARDESDRAKVDFIMNLVNPGMNQAVPDPYYGGRDGFETIYQMLDKACQRLADQIEQKP